METNFIPKEENPNVIARWYPVMKRWWFVCVHRWYLFAIAIAVSLAIGWYYANTRTELYMKSSMMLIEDAQNAGGNASNGAVNALLQLNGVSVGDNLTNESYILTTERLMRNVVDTLNIDVDYTTEASMRTVTLYNNRPFTIFFAEPDVAVTQEFDVEIQENNQLKLYNFSADEEATLIANTGTTVRTPAGTLRIFAERTFAQFPKNTPIRIVRYPLDIAAHIYSRKITAAPYDKNSSLLQMTCVDVNPQRASDILVEVFNAYKRDVVNNKNRVAQATAKFIDERISIIGQELGQVENRMAEFKRDNRVVDFAQSATATLNETNTARQRSLQLETEMSVAKYLLDFLVSHAHREEVIPILSGGNMGAYSNAIAEYNRLMLQRNQTLANTSDASPAVRQFDAQLASLRASIIAAVRSQVNALGLELREARKAEGAAQNALTGTPMKERQALDIQRQQELKSTLYTFLLNKREEVALQLSMNEANVRLVELPNKSNAPFSPQKRLIFFIALGLGVLLPLGYIVVMNLLNTTIASRQEVENMVDIPILGEIPAWDEAATKRLIDRVSPSLPIVEAFRILRFNLRFLRQDAKVIAVTSSTPGQGKTFISTNLATAIAMTGKRVLLIDADIRKRTLTLDAHHGTALGLTSYLVDEAQELSLADIIIPNGLTERVDMIASGPMPPNPAEILLSERLAHLLAEAKATYDYVLIDTTPYLSVADASIICQQADVTLYNLRIGVQPRSFLPQLQKMYAEKRFKNLLLLINDSDERTRAYGYGYGYGYTYGDKSREIPLTGWRRWFPFSI